MVHHQTRMGFIAYFLFLQQIGNENGMGYYSGSVGWREHCHVDQPSLQVSLYYVLFIYLFYFPTLFKKSCIIYIPYLIEPCMHGLQFHYFILFLLNGGFYQILYSNK